jgi:acetyl esterase/lipase
MGDRRSASPWLEQADMIGKTLAKGIAFASIEYRLGYEAHFPGAVHDANAALRYLARFSSELQLDTERVALWGESAGSHLAMLTAYTRGLDFFKGDLGVRAENPLQIRLMLNWFGATDLNTIKRPMDGSNESLPDGVRYTPEYFNLGADRHTDPELRKLASPITHLAGATMPTVIYHGTGDSMVPFQQALALQTALTTAGREVELIAIVDAEHGWMGQPQDKVTSIVQESIDRIATELKG